MIIRLSLTIFLALFATNAIALNESTVVNEMQTILLSGKKCSERPSEGFWKIKSVRTQVHLKYWKKGDYNLYFSKFGCGLGKNGAVVIAPGRTESSVEFYETAIDFVERGFSPIYVVDHVSQGFSPRLLEDGHKGHINRFSDYINAFDSAVKAIEADLKTKEGRSNKKNQPLYFLSNSMGGAIGIGYFQKKGENNPFSAATLLGPMIRINYLGFPTGDPAFPNGITHPTWKQKQLFSETGVIAQARVYCKTLGCDAYATKGARETAEANPNGGAYIEGKKNFAAAWKWAPEQVMTHSKERYDLKTWLWESAEMKAMYKRVGITSPQLAAPTYQWAKQAAKFNRDMRTEREVEKMSAMPIKIITGEKDVRSYTPYKDGSTDLSEHVKFCNTVKNLKGNGACNFLQIDDAFHELHKESREYRKPALDAALEHFLKN